MKRRGSSRKIAPGLVALSSAAILTIYSAGFVRTRAASERFADDDVKRVGSPPEAGPVVMPEGPPPSAGASSAPGVRAAIAVPAAPARTHAPAPPSLVSAAAETPPPASEAIEPLVPRLSAVPAAPPASAAPVAPTQTVYRDGTFSGWGTSRHGDIQATVVIDGGRIASAVISQCLTRYSCSWISNLPPQVVGRQSADVDYVSGATQSTNAFYYAILEALSKAK
jgi:uncharacterized protein with FMN-binding domain